MEIIQCTAIRREVILLPKNIDGIEHGLHLWAMFPLQCSVETCPAWKITPEIALCWGKGKTIMARSKALLLIIC